MELAAKNNNLVFVEDDIEGSVSTNEYLKNDSDRFGLLLYQALVIIMNGMESNINYA